MGEDLKFKTGIKSKVITVDYLARVEGEGALHIETHQGEVKNVQLKIFEPPRFFEALLKGRSALEAPDITARICGICPVAYIMSACHAVEDALNIKVTEDIRQLRRLLYCGEWIESHVLHIVMLHAPDFFRVDDVVGLAKLHKDKVESGLTLKKAGNSIVEVLGGREIHPVNVKVGGFYKLPGQSEFKKLKEQLKQARGLAVNLVKWVSSFDFPDLERDYEFVSTSHESEYPFNEGNIKSNLGLDITTQEFEQHFEEIHVPYTNALHSVHKGHGSYCVGPFARFNLNQDKLSPITQQLAKDVKLWGKVNNPSKTIVIRALEVFQVLNEAVEIIENMDTKMAPSVDVPLRAGIGMSCTEAPRGSLYHRYQLDSAGKITEAKIIPPTSQNQKAIEEDLYDLVKANIKLPKDELTWVCEQAVRNYDPCISCATHFLKVKFDER